MAIDKTDPISTAITFKLANLPYIEYQIDADLNMVIAPLPAESLVKMEGIANGELFAWNVRQWLGKKTKVNRDVENSIQAKAEHKYFPAFHNGLTVLCKSLALVNKDLTISGYAVVNGCQSLTGLYENRDKLTPQLKILTKFIQIQPESTLARKITDHTNNQNGTTYRDLQSNNPIQTRLQTEVDRIGNFRYRIKAESTRNGKIPKIGMLSRTRWPPVFYWPMMSKSLRHATKLTGCLMISTPIFLGDQK